MSIPIPTHIRSASKRSPRRLTGVPVAAILTVARALPAAAGAATASSPFNANDRGWRVVHTVSCANPTPAVPTFSATGGNPGG